MKDQDRFKKSMAMLGEVYDKDISEAKLKIYWNIFKEYTADAVESAIASYIKNPDSAFFPKPGEIIKYMDGVEITSDMVIAAAKLGDTPMGILARIHIGTWDLNNHDSFYLRQRAAECLHLMLKWKKRAACGEYTDHEISVMLKHGVRPEGPFYHGVVGPSNFKEVLSRAERISKSDRHLLFIQDNTETDENDKNACLHPDIEKKLSQQ